MTKAEQTHKRRVAELGCMACKLGMNIHTPDVELHHLRAGQGWGKGDYLTLIPLCYEHHRGNMGVHGLGTKGWPKHYAFTEQQMLDETLRRIKEQA